MSDPGIHQSLLTRSEQVKQALEDLYFDEPGSRNLDTDFKNDLESRLTALNMTGERLDLLESRSSTTLSRYFSDKAQGGMTQQDVKDVLVNAFADPVLKKLNNMEFIFQLLETADDPETRTEFETQLLQTFFELESVLEIEKNHIQTLLLRSDEADQGSDTPDKLTGMLRSFEEDIMPEIRAVTDMICEVQDMLQSEINDIRAAADEAKLAGTDHISPINSREWEQAGQGPRDPGPTPR